MPILLAGTIEIVHIEQVSALFTFRLGQVLLYYILVSFYADRLCGLVVRVPGYSSRGPGSIPGTTRFYSEVVGLERGPLSLVSTNEELTE
jgi:hypothetical protein